MSLQVWLPLINNTNNQGISNETNATRNTGTYTDGKIGKSLHLANTADRLNATFPGIIDKTIWSVATWLKISSSEGTPNYQHFFNLGMNNDGANNYFRFEHTNTAGYTQFITPKRTDYGSNTNGYWGFISGCNKAKDIWVHVAVTNDGTNYRTYFDGVLNTTTAINLFTPTTSKLTGTLQIGTSGAYCFLNDFRIYDHCLSPKEVKEISKALVCHYPLDNNGIGNPNLVTGTSCNEVQYTYPSEGFVDRWATTTPAVPSASQYTLSFFAKSTVNGDQIRAHWYNPNTTTRCESSQGIVTTYGDGNINVTLSTEWKFYWIVYTQSETTAVKHLILPRMGRSDIAPGTGTVSIKCVKLEEGNKATPWCPHTSDASYSIFNINGTTEFDTSGYKYNGTRNAVTVVSDSPRYSCATKFDGASSSIIATQNFMYNGQLDWTYSCWLKLNVTNVNGCLWSCRDSVTSAGTAIFFVGGGGFYVDDGDRWTISPTTALITNVWYHIAIVRSKSNGKFLYINGLLDKSTTSTGTPTNTSATNFAIGASQYSNTTVSGNYLNGCLNDVRIYTTALSADDIKQLYQVSASIDNGGNILAGDIVETSGLVKPTIEKNTIIQNNEFDESEAMNLVLDNSVGQKAYFTYSYIPVKDTNNSCLRPCYVDFSVIPNLSTSTILRAIIQVTWSGFDTSSTAGTFAMYWSGDNFKISTNAWAWEGTNPIMAAINAKYDIKNLVLSATSGSYIYDVTFNLTQSYINTYSRARIGVRTDYSNGTAKFSMDKIILIEDKYSSTSSTKAHMGKDFMAGASFIEK